MDAEKIKLGIGIYQNKKKLNNQEKIIIDKLNIKPENFDTLIDQPIDSLPPLEECNITLENIIFKEKNWTCKFNSRKRF